MQTMRVGSHSSRFLALLQLARQVAEAPAGRDGIPCVLIGSTRKEFGTIVFARTGNPDLDAEIEMPDKEESQIQAALEYLGGRLKSIGLKLVKTESELPVSIV